MRNRRVFLATLTFVGLAASLPHAQQVTVPSDLVSYPELIVYNGKVITVDDKDTIAQAVAIRDGKFLAVGDDNRILALAGPSTRKIDLKGKSVVPGFIDTHLHQAFAGQVSKKGTSGRVTFKTKESGLDEVTLGVPRNPAFFSVTRKDLDVVAPNNPIVLTSVGTDTTVNTLALKLSNIPSDTPGLGKGASGEPDGKLEGWAAGIVLYEAKPWPPFQDVVEEQKEMFATANSEGLTTVMARAQGLSISVFRDLWLKKQLTARVRATHEFLRMNPYGEAYLKRLGNLRHVQDHRDHCGSG
jgi:predicted amidohydrolase YtcJ